MPIKDISQLKKEINNFSRIIIKIHKMEKGVFTKEQEKTLATMVDEALKLKGFLELVDGYLAKIIITLVDDNLIDKLKVEIKEKLALVVDQVMIAEAAEDPEVKEAAILAAEDALADLLNSLIDVPGLDEESEGLIFKGAVELLAGVLLKWVEDKTAEL